MERLLLEEMAKQGRQKASDIAWSKTGGKDLAAQGVWQIMFQGGVLYQH